MYICVYVSLHVKMRNDNENARKNANAAKKQ